MLEKLIPNIGDYYLPPRKLQSESNNNEFKLIALQVPNELNDKLERLSKVERQDILRIVRAIVMSTVDKIDI